ncbi:unnamed protein product [Sympodiomycopsis kandeliae]
MSLLRTAAQRAASRSVAATPSFASTSRRTLASSSIARSNDPQLGTYPDVPAISRQRRKYDKNYWDPQEKANFGETLHEQEDILGVFAPDLHPNVTPQSAARQLGVAALCFAGFFTLIYYMTPEAPFVRRTYPRNGLAEELGNPQVAGLPYGYYDQNDDEEEEDDE